MSATAGMVRRVGALLALLTLVGALFGGAASARVLGAQGVKVAAETPKAPKITKQPTPKALTVEEGEPASFESAASGTPTPTVQWERSTNGGASWSPIPGATSPTLTIASTVIVRKRQPVPRRLQKRRRRSRQRARRMLTVHKAPAVTKQPLSVTVEEGQNATFEATASGFPAPTVKWETSQQRRTTWTAVAGAHLERAHDRQRQNARTAATSTARTSRTWPAKRPAKPRR